MNKENLLKERIALFKNSVKVGEKINSKIPHISNMWTWKFYEQGISYRKALTDYDILAKSFRTFLTYYKCDAIEEAGWRNPILPYESLGYYDYQFDKTDQYSISIKDNCYIFPEDYDAVIANPKSFLLNVYIPRKFPKFAQENLNKEDMQKFIAEYGKFGANCMNIASICKDEYALAPLTDSASPFTASAYEIMFSYMRGIKGISIDLRRNTQKLYDVCEALDSVYSLAKYENTPKYMGSCPNSAFDEFIVPIGHSVLSTKQFEKFYWPSLKKHFDYIEEYDKIAYIFAESENSRFYDFFKELKEGHGVAFFELDDPYNLKTELSNLTLVACSTVDMLYNGTKEQCVDEVKRLINDLGSDGKIILSENKMMSFPRDAKPENLKAVYEYINSYER